MPARWLAFIPWIQSAPPPCTRSRFFHRRASHVRQVLYAVDDVIRLIAPSVLTLDMGAWGTDAILTKCTWLFVF